MNFKFSANPASWDPSITVIRLNGSIDSTMAPEFEQQALAVVASGKPRVILDCADLDFISSAGIGVLMVILGAVERAGGFLKVMNAPEDIYESFDMLGITEIIEFLKNEKEGSQARA
ncbi:MAG: hypothetical protein A3G34_03145 [Candidatus Lindowbacteria bacterium RIFCSPLOWO2_12_FULL_62_27]|nr:MAG: hypothetical protein A3I06_08270 [Candidatus Lindowbacteria bacterium RIFCSPLOWO2_02_FULL_62_12]OGH59293.1 MAG: hypothetical protein A3G34_03145 [Candidatus Lindowbacteria bacterium RIFCSPLOWO2_12_FULL_62_27]